MDPSIPTLTVVPCPKCGTHAQLGPESTEARCEACNTIFSRQPVPAAAKANGLPWDRVALAISIVVFGAGVAAWAASHRGSALSAQPSPAVRPVTSVATPTPSVPPPQGMPAGEIAWVAEARGPVLTDLDGDGVEDVFGFFREWDGRSAWTTFAGGFKGPALLPLWRTEALDPWIARKEGVVPTAVVVGHYVVVADGTDQLFVYRASGEKEATYKLKEPPRNLCTTGSANRVWIDAEQPISVAVDSGKTQPASTAPAGCTRWLPPLTAPASAASDAGNTEAFEKAKRRFTECNEDFSNPFSHAACIPGDAMPNITGFDARYALRDGPSSVELGTMGESPRVPAALGLGAGGKVAWQRPLAADASTKSPESAPRLAEFSKGTLYVVYDKVYFDSRLAALDAKKGTTLWDVPLVDSLPRVGARAGRGGARRLVASDARVYVARVGGGLDVFDAKTGATVGTIGGAK